jgi:hypothetical protein
MNHYLSQIPLAVRSRFGEDGFLVYRILSSDVILNVEKCAQHVPIGAAMISYGN